MNQTQVNQEDFPTSKEIDIWQSLIRLTQLGGITSARTRNYFNSHARHHAYHYGSRHSDPGIYVSMLDGIQRRDSDERVKILDIGCGDGSFIKNALVAGIDADFIGFDVAVNMLKVGKDSLDYSKVQLLAADGFKLPFRPGVKFDLIHLDSVLHHLIGKTRADSVHLIELFCEQLRDRLSENGSLVVEEIYYTSHLFPQITSRMIFYGLKLLNFLHLDLSKFMSEVLPGLEVNFLHQSQIEQLFGRYGIIKLIKQTPWPVPRLYRVLLLKDHGHISYIITGIPRMPSKSARAW
jgi:SAM-dependent methyltransferase